MAQELTFIRVLRRFLLWLLICSVSAAPSFVFAGLDGANMLGMSAGVLLFVIAYTALTCTAGFQRFYERPYIRSTLRFGYGARLVFSTLATVVLVAPQESIFILLPDIYAGVLSVTAGSALLGNTPREAVTSFTGAMLITCIQGALLNGVVFLLMAIFYALRRRFGPPCEEPRRGFEVITPSALSVEGRPDEPT
jgi:hypothetical protein